MFKHILIPTDGSSLAQGALAHAVEIAKEIGAKITVVAISDPFHASIVEPMRVKETLEAHDRLAESSAATILSRASAAAEAAGVTCNTVHVCAEPAHRAIVETAQKEGCDLIIMALNRHRGISAVLHESETVLVLKHCTVAMLIV
ncbi:universal stress protein [Mesorhizobium comanense]|uniref:universal stress protein n=1 Tax=Mesorhizobium comanense TaxID=2502215 RepID=UPI0010F57441|nr:universal stress protein [Mesorhizobium comanense]